MTKKIVILGSTGSIGSSTLKSIKGKKKFKVELLTSNRNIKKLLSQAIKYKVKNSIIEDEKSFKKYYKIFKNKKIKLHLGIKNINKILNRKVNYCINAISGIDGLEPTLKSIPYTKNILIANKETIITGWDFIKKKLKLFNTNFIPIDSEHYSIWELTKNKKVNDVEKIILTASGGPFLNKSKKITNNIKPKFALKHPNWKMGKKISIESSNLMNKIFEYIEAKKIFNIKKKNISILIHPTSFIHAIVFYRGNFIKLLAHTPNMIIPISNALGIKSELKKNEITKNIQNLMDLSFYSVNVKKFPLVKLLDIIPENSSYFETVLITLNDCLVEKYLKGKINYVSIEQNLLKLTKDRVFMNYYKLKPKNVYDIKKMILFTKNYLENNLKHYDK